MTAIVYTTGYSRRTPGQLRQIVMALEAVVFDIRFSPRSHRPAWWSKKALIELLGERYNHVGALGNKNYQSGGDIEIVDYETGRRLIEQSERPVILLCVCPPENFRTCHRTIIAEQLRAEGFQVEELANSAITHL
ncbi:MAG: hypothetical protein BroJett011_42400 [Chloroflexota bacterium]|nr:MAG: hypothetical protein BroJett011_42400 [Chloroflexota bacterium]